MVNLNNGTGKNVLSRRETVKGYKQIDIVRLCFEAYRKIMVNDFDIISEKYQFYNSNSFKLKFDGISFFNYELFLCVNLLKCRFPQQHLSSKWVRIVMAKGMFLNKEYSMVISHLETAFKKFIFFPVKYKK